MLDKREVHSYTIFSLKLTYNETSYDILVNVFSFHNL